MNFHEFEISVIRITASVVIKLKIIFRTCHFCLISMKNTFNCLKCQKKIFVDRMEL